MERDQRQNAGARNKIEIGYQHSILQWFILARFDGSAGFFKKLLAYPSSISGAIYCIECLICGAPVLLAHCLDCARHPLN